MFLKRKMNDSTNSYSDKILQIKEKIRQADAVIVGAGAGLSTAAGFVYTGDRFTYYFSDFEKKVWVFRYVFRWILSLCDFRGTLGILEQVYLYQSIYGCAKTGISESV